MKSGLSLLILVAGFGLYILAGASLYTVSETEQVIITQFGRPVGETVSEAGLHFKTPFIQKVNRFDKRILEWDGPPANMPTKDKVYIVVDTFARWRIIEPRAFFARPEHFVCGAVAVAYQGRAPATLVPLATSIERLRARDRSSLRHCADAADGRSALAPAVTVPCSSRPRWQTTSWILWSALYDDNPGRATLRARAAQLCGVGATFSLPAAASWREGFPRTWCYRKYA